MKRLLSYALFLISFVSAAAFAQPANDLCIDATPINCGQTLFGETNISSTNDAPGYCGTTNSQGVWYTFYGDGSAATLSTCNQADFDTKILVYSGSCGSLTCVDGNDDASGCGGFTSELTIGTTCGLQYFVYITGFGGAEGNFDLTLNCAGPGFTFPIALQDVTVQLDGTGNYNFTTPLYPQVDASQAIGLGSSTAINVWQSFTALNNGILDNVKVTYASVPSNPTVDVVIRDGEGIGGSVIYVETITVSASGVPTVIDVDGTFDLVAGNQYTIELQGFSPQEMQKNSGDPYAGGVSNFGVGTDLVFSVDILQRPLIDNGTASANGIDHWELSQSNFSCANTASPVPVILSVYDKLGNVSACVANVTVEDNIDPVAVCVPYSAASQVPYSYSSNPSIAIPDNDPAGITDVITVSDTYDAFDLDVLLTIDHTWTGDLFVSLQSPTGTVVDLIPLSFSCSENDLDVVFDDAAGSAFSSECSSPIVGTFTPAMPLSGFNGENVSGNWTLTVSDNAGLDFGTLQSWGLNIIHDIPASFTELALDGTGVHVVDPASIDAGSSDNCSVTLSTSPASFSCADIGVQTITLTAEDPSGNTNSCVTQVMVVDNTAPTAICQDATVVLDGSGSGSITVSDINNGSSDNCGIASTGLDITDFTCGDLGPNTVELTVQDVNGLSSSCTATVTVQDNDNPVITCPSDITVCSASASGSLVSYPTVTATDNCTFTITQTDGSGLTSGSMFPIGTTAQSWSAVDIASNAASCSFNVIVNASPTADYSYSAACQGEAIFFTDESSVDPSTSIVSWSWNMGDGSGPITLVDPIHSYADLGTYNVTLTVETAEGCVQSASQTVNVTPVPDASFTFTAACEGSATTFTNTSTIAAGAMNYAWNFGDGGTSSLQSPTHVYAIDGTYTVTLTVTSTDGCDDVTTASVTINDSPTALFSASTVCEGASTVFTNLSTGGGALTYSWDFGDGGSSGLTNPSHTYAADGVYTVTLTATNGSLCSNTHTATVTVNNLPTADFTFSDGCEGIASNFVNTSTAGTYTWDLGDGSSSTLTNVNHLYSSFGIYDVTLNVTSAQFCMSSVTQTIEIFDLPDFSLTASDVLCFGGSSGSIVATPLGSPTGPWTLSLNGLTPQASLTFNGLQAGSYNVTVLDGNSCNFTVSTTVNQPSAPLAMSIDNVQNVLCHGGSSGSVTVQATGGTAPYSYALDGGGSQASGTFTGLEAGNHSIFIVDANNCEFNASVNLSEPDTLVLVLNNASNLLCHADNSGSITVNGTGGVADYQYNLNGGAYGLSNTFSGLAAASYIVGVLDANGCTDTLHVTLSEPGILQLSLLNSVDASCFGQLNGSLTVGAASGTAPYQYSLNGVNFQGSGTFAGLGAGTYTVSVRDANGCLDDLTETIFEPSELTIETNSTPVACFGQQTGEIEILASGGTPTYEYSINEGATFLTNGGNFTGVSNGNYIAVVRDVNGCTASEGVIITQPSAAFSLTANITNAACLFQSSGAVQLVGSGGTPTYSYSSDNINFGSSNNFSGFAAGQYTFYAHDLNGCQATFMATIGQPATAVNINNVLLVNPACPNQSSGTATVQANGGTPGYTYSSNGGLTFQTGAILSGLNGGNHLIVVKDANGCLDSDTITLTSPPLLDIILDTVIGVPCENNYSGEIHVTAEGGTPSYNYFLNGGSLQSNGDYTNLTSGTYTISILDVNGCSYAETFAVMPEQMLPTAAFSFTLSGTAVLFANQSQFGDEYLWEFGDGSTSTEQAPVHVYAVDGNYQVTLTVTNGCGSESVTILVSTTTIGINDNEPLSFSVYPNPASTELYLQPNGLVPSNLNIDIISTSGQWIQTVVVSQLDASGRIRIDVQGLAQGIYYLRAIGNEHQSVVRFDIIK